MHSWNLWPGRLSFTQDKNYIPAGCFPTGSFLVISKSALREFELLLRENDKVSDAAIAKSNGHKERHAQNREQILGAAFAVLTKWPDQCVDSKGNPVASKIANLVETQARLFWPGELPPLTVDSIADHLREWIKKTNTSK